MIRMVTRIHKVSAISAWVSSKLSDKRNPNLYDIVKSPLLNGKLKDDGSRLEVKDIDLASFGMKNIMETVFNFNGTNSKLKSKNARSSNISKRIRQESSDDISDDEINENVARRLPTISDTSRHSQNKELEAQADAKYDPNRSRNEVVSLLTHQDYDLNISRNYFKERRGERYKEHIEKRVFMRGESSGLNSSHPSSNKHSSDQSFKYSSSSALIFINPTD